MTIHGVSNAAPGFELEYAPEPADNTHSVASKELFLAQVPEDSPPPENSQDALTAIFRSLQAREDLSVELRINQNTGYAAIINTETGKPILYSDGAILSLPPGSDMLDLLPYIEHLPQAVYTQLNRGLRAPLLPGKVTVLRKAVQDFQWFARLAEQIRQTTGRLVVTSSPNRGTLRLVLIDLNTKQTVLIAGSDGRIGTRLSSYAELYPYIRHLSEISYNYLSNKFVSSRLALPGYLELQRHNLADSIPAMSDAERDRFQTTLANTPTRMLLLGLLPPSLQSTIGKAHSPRATSDSLDTIRSELRWAYLDPAAEGYNELRMMVELIREQYPVYSTEFVLTHLTDFLSDLASPHATPFFLNADYSEHYAERMNNVQREIARAIQAGRSINLAGQDLIYLDLTGLDLGNANLNRANLTGVIANGVNFAEAQLVGADLTDARLRAAQFSGANLNQATLQNTGLRGGKLQGANLSETIISGADFGYSNLRRADLTQSNSSKKVSFNNADLNRADLSHAVLKDASFPSANLTSTQFVGAIFQNALNMTRAILHGADFTNATLPQISSFDEATFGDLERTNMSGVNLTKAYLSDSNFSPERIITDDNTQLPPYRHYSQANAEEALRQAQTLQALREAYQQIEKNLKQSLEPIYQSRLHDFDPELSTALRLLNTTTNIDSLLTAFQRIDSQLLAPDFDIRKTFDQRWRELFAQLPPERISPVLQATYDAYIAQNLEPIFPKDIRIGANTPTLLHNLRIPNSQFQDLQTRNTIVQGGDWSGVWFTTTFDHYMLANTAFIAVDMSGIRLSITVKNSRFINSNMQGAQIARTIEQTEFRNANLTRANIHDSRLLQLTLSDTQLIRAQLTNVSWSDSDLSDVDLSGATLDGGTIGVTNFSRAVLSGTRFIGVELNQVTGLETTTGQIRVPINVANLELSLSAFDAQLRPFIEHGIPANRISIEIQNPRSNPALVEILNLRYRSRGYSIIYASENINGNGPMQHGRDGSLSRLIPGGAETSFGIQPPSNSEFPGLIPGDGPVLRDPTALPTDSSFGTLFSPNTSGLPGHIPNGATELPYNTDGPGGTTYFGGNPHTGSGDLTPVEKGGAHTGGNRDSQRPDFGDNPEGLFDNVPPLIPEVHSRFTPPTDTGEIEKLLGLEKGGQILTQPLPDPEKRRPQPETFPNNTRDVGNTIFVNPLHPQGQAPMQASSRLVEAAISLLKQQPTAQARIDLLRQWAAAEDPKLRAMLSTEDGVEQLLTYGYQGNVLQALTVNGYSGLFTEYGTSFQVMQVLIRVDPNSELARMAKEFRQALLNLSGQRFEQQVEAARQRFNQLGMSSMPPIPSIQLSPATTTPTSSPETTPNPAPVAAQAAPTAVAPPPEIPMVTVGSVQQPRYQVMQVTATENGVPVKQNALVEFNRSGQPRFISVVPDNTPVTGMDESGRWHNAVSKNPITGEYTVGLAGQMIPVVLIPLTPGMPIPSLGPGLAPTLIPAL